MMVRILTLLLTLGLAAVQFEPARADAPPTAQPTQEDQLKAAWTAAAKTATRGPAVIKLLDEAQLNLTGDEVFVPAAETNQIMTALGNGTSSARYGMIVSRANGAQWMVVVTWVKEGYVRDGDAKEWQADALLQSVREGTENANAERVARGLPALDVVGWVEPPTYDNAKHQLVWSLLARDHGAAADEPQLINYNTYALGRDGFFSLNLVTNSDHVATDKTAVHQLLDTLAYTPGKRYDDFNQSTDKVAAYGLAALVGAVAVKKLGLLALGAAFFVKIWKVGMLALIGGAAALRRFFRRRNPPPAASS